MLKIWLFLSIFQDSFIFLVGRRIGNCRKLCDRYSHVSSIEACCVGGGVNWLTRTIGRPPHVGLLTKLKRCYSLISDNATETMAESICADATQRHLFAQSAKFADTADRRWTGFHPANKFDHLNEPHTRVSTIPYIYSKQIRQCFQDVFAKNDKYDWIRKRIFVRHKS